MRTTIKVVQEKFPERELMGAEIGVKNGKHALEIVKNLTLHRFYLIDCWAPYIEDNKIIYDPPLYYDDVVDKFKNYANVEILRGTSHNVSKGIPNNILDFVYIDACHQYEFVFADIVSWYPKVKKGGIIGGHDYGIKWAGVTDAVRDHFNGCCIQKINFDKTSDWWVVKP
jgi:hypothetical protein